MKVVVAKVDEVLFDEQARSLAVPGAEGQLQVLPHHMPFITTLGRGIVRVQPQEGSEQSFPIDSGILEVHSDGATVIL
jgi:F-type H+-transporting ATPase subunit epsilon